MRGLVKQHLDSFNYFVNTGIKKIVRANDRIVSGVDPSIWLRLSSVVTCYLLFYFSSMVTFAMNWFGCD